MVRGSTNLVRGPAGPKKLPQSLVGLICFTQNFVNYFGSQKRVFLASTGPQCKSWQASLQWDAQSGLLPPLGNLLLYRTKYYPISQTLQRETFLSFVRRSLIFCHSSTDTKQTCLKCLLSQHLLNLYLVWDGTLRKYSQLRKLSSFSYDA